MKTKLNGLASLTLFTLLTAVTIFAPRSYASGGSRDGGGGFTFDRSIELLTLARSQLVSEIDQVKSKTLDEAPERREIIKQALTNMQILEKNDLLPEKRVRNGQPLMFDYNKTAPYKVEPLFDYYYTYASVSPERYQLELIELKRRLIHEASHIFGFNTDEQARAFALEVYPLNTQIKSATPFARYKVSMKLNIGLLFKGGFLRFECPHKFKVQTYDHAFNGNDTKENMLFEIVRDITGEACPSHVTPELDVFIMGQEKFYTKRSVDPEENDYFTFDADVSQYSGCFPFCSHWVKPTRVASVSISPNQKSVSLIVFVQDQKLIKRTVTFDSKYEVRDDDGSNTVVYDSAESSRIVTTMKKLDRSAIEITIERQ